MIRDKWVLEWKERYWETSSVLKIGKRLILLLIFFIH